MIKEKEFYRFGQFTDFEGQIHKFTIAAIVARLPENLELLQVQRTQGGYYTSLRSYDGLSEPIKIAILLGVSFCHPDDIVMYNEKIGMQIAANKAVSPKTAARGLFLNDLSMVTEKMIGALLENESECIQNNTGAYIKGYDNTAMKYAEKVSLQQDYAVLTDEEKEATKVLLKSKNKNIIYNVATSLKQEDLKDVIEKPKRKVKRT